MCNQHLCLRRDSAGQKETMNTVEKIQKDLKDAAGGQLAVKKQRFFKTGPGEYGEGDIFIGVDVPGQRRVAKRYFRGISLDELAELLKDPVHEFRKVALFMLVGKFKKAKKDAGERDKLARFYLDHLDGVDNWDLVDSSAHYILGPWLHEQQDAALTDSVLDTLAANGNLWRERIAVLTTFHFIKQGDFDKTLQLAERFLSHPHDLIHKAVGWMLREIGKRSKDTESGFLRRHCRVMPRTMLRYAIEKFPAGERRLWLQGGVKF